MAVMVSVFHLVFRHAANLAGYEAQRHRYSALAQRTVLLHELLITTTLDGTFNKTITER